MEDDAPVEHLLREMLAMQLYLDFKDAKDPRWTRLRTGERNIFRRAAERIGDGLPVAAYSAFRAAKTRKGLEATVMAIEEGQ